MEKVDEVDPDSGEDHRLSARKNNARKSSHRNDINKRQTEVETSALSFPNGLL